MATRRRSGSPALPPLTPEQALPLLKDLIARGEILASNRTLSHEDFTIWHDESSSTLAGVFGDSSASVETFRSYSSYGGPLIAYADPRDIQSSRIEAMSKSLAALKGYDRQLQVRTTTTASGQSPLPIAPERNKIFISHSTHDASIVQDFVDDILETGCGVPHDQIFFSSSADQGIPPGQYFVPYIQSKVRESRVLIPWISPSYYKSAFCMCELGAAWAFLPEGGLLPILAGTDHSDLAGILHGMQVLKADSKEDMNILRDQLIKSLTLKARSTDRWEKRRNSFIRQYLEKGGQFDR